jgi:uncharacterized protein (DUF4415 family)
LWFILGVAIGAVQITLDPNTASILDEEWFETARVATPEAKIPVSILVDRDILEWFKAQGPRYQSRMNAVLKADVAARRSDPEVRSAPNP